MKKLRNGSGFAVLSGTPHPRRQSTTTCQPSLSAACSQALRTYGADSDAVDAARIGAAQGADFFDPDNPAGAAQRR